jgi:hypothetical protein
MKGTIRLDHLNKNILITASFARASMNPDNCEYKKLVEIRMLHPDYSVVKRSIKRNPEKESYRGLTYAYMEHYILTHDKSGEVMKIYEEMRLRALCHSIRYAHIKKWFLEIYPEIDDFSCKKIGESATLPLAS